LDEAYPDIQDSTVSDLDICLYSEEEEHIHYIELKKDLENGRQDTARSQIRKAYCFWNEMNYTVSATEAYLEEAELRHHSILENEEDVRAGLEKVIDDTSEPEYAENRVVEKEELEAFIDLDLPIDDFGRKLHPDYALEEQLRKRFDEIPEQEEVQIAIYSHKKEEVILMRAEVENLFGEA
jgi:hypothetical protein